MFFIITLFHKIVHVLLPTAIKGNISVSFSQQLQSYVRMWRAKKAYQDRLQYFKDNVGNSSTLCNGHFINTNRMAMHLFTKSALSIFVSYLLLRKNTLPTVLCLSLALLRIRKNKLMLNEWLSNIISPNQHHHTIFRWWTCFSVLTFFFFINHCQLSCCNEHFLKADCNCLFQEHAIVKIQAHFRSNLAQNDYKALSKSHFIQLSRVSQYLASGICKIYFF